MSVALLSYVCGSRRLAQVLEFMKSTVLCVALAAIMLPSSNVFADAFLDSLLGLPYTLAKKKLLAANYHPVHRKSSMLDKNAPPELYIKYPEIEHCAADEPLCRYSFRSGTSSIAVISQYTDGMEIHNPGVVSGWTLDADP